MSSSVGDSWLMFAGCAEPLAKIIVGLDEAIA